MNLSKLLLLSICLSSTTLVNAQDNVKNFLILGVDAAEDISSDYIAPLTEGLVYGLTGGWYNSAKVKDSWTVELSIVGNGSFIPREKESFVLDATQYENLQIVGGALQAEVPTIVGRDLEPVLLIASLNGEEFQFESPESLSLLNLNLLPSGFFQGKVSMPQSIELGLRYFPKIDIDGIKVGLFGLGVQHEFSRWINAMENSKWALSAMVAYTNINGEYEIEDQDLVRGDNQSIDSNLDSWLFQLIGSTNFRIFNVYGGIGYVTGDSVTKLLGTYIIDTAVETITYTDPLQISNKVSGMRANIGLLLRLGWFSLNTDYTFQGYNNFSIGLHFKVN